MRATVVFCTLLISGRLALAAAGGAEQRAVDYLAREVPRWSREHACFSCHNNGDGARALLAAKRRGHSVPAEALADTLRWLVRPEGWEANPSDPRAADRALARIQFAATLVEAARGGPVKNVEALDAAAALVGELQQPDGSWKIEGTEIGSPATYGSALATAVARRIVRVSAPRRLSSVRVRTDRWLRTARPATVLDAAALLIGLAGSRDRAAREQARVCIELLGAAQNPDGGWGPYRKSASEPFDTAVALLGLASWPGSPRSIERGRKYLVATQLEDGSWPETTRPPRGESYAQRISTTAWALQALLDTR